MQDLYYSSPYGHRHTPIQERIPNTCETRAYMFYYYYDSQGRRRVHEFQILWDTDSSQVIYADGSHAYPLELPSHASIYDILERLQLQDAQLDLQWVDPRISFEENLYDSPVQHIPIIELYLYDHEYDDTKMLQG